MVKVQAGAVKRLGKRSVRGTSARRDTPGEDGRDLGAEDGTVATGAATMGDGRGAAGMFSRVMCSLRSCPRCWWTKES